MRQNSPVRTRRANCCTRGVPLRGAPFSAGRAGRYRTTAEGIVLQAGAGMSHKDSFGLRLRAARERQAISLQSIAERTKVSVTHWEEMERNDFSRWPTGLFARAYVRDYSTIVGLNPEEVVDEFCRYFPNGDRRR